MSSQGFEFRDLEGDDLPGWTLRLLIRSGKTTAAHVAHKLNIRAQILRDIAPVVSVTGPGLPAIRGKNLEWAANELEIAGETIVALASTVPRTAQDELNEAEVVALRVALERAAFIADNLHSMIDRDTWRDTGGDDGQGHYEGDHWAEQCLQEIQGLAALAREEQP